MKRVLVLLVLIVGINPSFAGDADTIASGVELYQRGDYNGCISTMKASVKNDPTSAIGYYYLALSYAKTGKKLLAIRNYDKVVALNSDKSLTALAQQGKMKLQGEGVTAIEAQIKDIEDDVKEAQVEEKQEHLTPAELRQKYEEKNVSTKKDEAKTSAVIKASDYVNTNRQPTNDEIVNAIRVLQKAGMLNGMSGMNTMNGMNGYNPQMDAKTQQMNAMLMMMNNNGNNNGMMNMMPFMNNNGKLDPQMIQMMMMNQMMPNFSSGNNNNGY